MKIFDSLLISFKRLIRNKSSIIYILLIMIASTAVIFNISFKESFEEYLQNYTMKNIEYRVYDANYGILLDTELNNDISNIYKMPPDEAENFIEKIKNKAMDYVSKLPHVVGVDFEGNGYMVNIDEIKINDDILFENEYLIGIPQNAEFNIIEGSLLSDYSKTDKVMICPNYFQNDYSSNLSSQYDAKKLLNKEVKLNFKGKEINYKIVGLYDKISTYSIGDKCYTTYENVNEINHDFIIEEKAVNENYIGLSGFAFMIDSVNNLEFVESELLKNGIALTPMAEIDTSLVYEIEKMCNIIVIIVCILIILITISNVIINIKKNNREYFIYNCLGYIKSDVFKIDFITNILNGLIGFLLSIIFSTICMKLLKNIVLIYNERLYLLNQHFGLNSLLLGLLISIIIPSVISLIILINNKFIRNNVLE